MLAANWLLCQNKLAKSYLQTKLQVQDSYKIYQDIYIYTRYIYISISIYISIYISRYSIEEITKPFLIIERKKN